MTTDDLDSTDQHSVLTDDGSDYKHGRKGRLKDAFSRTRNKISTFREEREAKKQAKAAKPSEDVDDFLAAGRTSFASSLRPSLTSDAPNSAADSTVSPRPSTSDSHSQPSPRRGPPISVPRIDVSAFSRFPNAKNVSPNAFIPQNDFGMVNSGNTGAGSLLKPEYKVRSQSSSSIASGSRKARIRGLSVGFADAPPVIIGEGGDSAQAPPVEISRAKARARSASPQGRKPYPDATVQSDGRRAMPPRGISDNSAGAFIPQMLSRIPTGLMMNSFSPKSPRGPHDDELIPKGVVRTQTGFSPTGSPRIRHQVPPAHPDPPAPIQPQRTVLPPSLGQIEVGKGHLTEEFERTMGFRPASTNSEVKGDVASPQQPQIVAPKPQRAPPSYDLIEKGRNGEFDSPTSASPRQPTAQKPMTLRSESIQSQQSPQSPYRYDLEHFQRRPVPAPQPSSSRTQSPLPPPLPAKPGAEQSRLDGNAAPQLSEAPLPVPPTQEYYPPPPQRQPTYVIRNIKQLPNMYASKEQRGPEAILPTESVPTTKAPLQVVTEQKNDSYRSFADRQRTIDSSQRFRATPPNSNDQRITSQHYEESPSDYADSVQATPQTVTEPPQTNLRFYERIRQETGSGNVV